MSKHFYLPLVDRKLFCAFNTVYNAKKDKFEKFPYDSNGVKGISIDDRHRLDTAFKVDEFLQDKGENAYTSSKEKPGWHLGFSFYEPVMMNGQYLVCVDIDIEENLDEQANDDVQRVIKALMKNGNYYERSVSGRGYHFMVLCDMDKIPKTHDSKKGWKVEVFSGIGTQTKLLCLTDQDVGGSLRSENLRLLFKQQGMNDDIVTPSSPQEGSTGASEGSYKADATAEKVDIDDPQLNLKYWTKDSIRKGYSTSSDGEINHNRSEVIYTVIKDLIKAGATDGQIVYLLTDKQYKLSEKANEKGSPKKAREWIAKQIPKLRKEVGKEIVKMNAILDSIGGSKNHYCGQGVRKGSSNDVRPTADDWVFVKSDDSWFNIKNGEKIGANAFNRAYKKYPPAVWTSANGDTRSKSMTPDMSTFLLAYCNALTVFDVLYIPYMGQVFELNGRQYANSYMPHLVPQADENWQESSAPKLIEGHLHKMFANKYEVKTLIQWMAWVVQNPGKKVRWAPLLIGAPGDGKSQLGIVMGLAMGSLNVRVVSQQELHENFTGWKYGHCLAVLEELKAVGKSRHDVSEKLKEPIANDTISVLRKGKDGFNTPNTQNYLALTNHKDAVIIEEADRRWFVMETVFSQQQKSAEKIFAEDYFDAIKGSAGAIRGWLLSVDTSDLNVNYAPPTNAAKDFMKARSKSSDATDILEMLELGGGYGYTSNVVSTDCLAKDFSDTYQQKLNSNRLSSALRELRFAKFDRVIKWRGTARRIYVKPHFLDGCTTEDSRNIRIRKELDSTMSTQNTGASRDFDVDSPYEYKYFKSGGS